MARGRRMSDSRRSFAYRYCVDRDGEKCMECGRGIGARTTRKEQKQGFGTIVEILEIDHINGNPADNRLINTQLLCRGCNLDKASRQSRVPPSATSLTGGVELGGRGGGPGNVTRAERALQGAVEKKLRGNASTERARKAIDYTEGETTLKANARYELTFRAYVVDLVKRLRQVKWSIARAAGAEVTGCSIKTAERYLEKLVSIEGELAIVPDEKGERYLSQRSKGE